MTSPTSSGRPRPGWAIVLQLVGILVFGWTTIYLLTALVGPAGPILAVILTWLVGDEADKWMVRRYFED